MKKRKKIILAISIPLAVVLILCGAMGIYVGDYYRPEAEAEQAFAQGETVGNCTVFDGGGETGVIFYPGGKVDEEAYAPLMKLLSERGITAVLVKMPFRLAVLNVNAAKDARKACPQVENWYIAGHSLGGAMASSYASKDDEIKGLILLGAYPTEKTDIPVLSFYGSADGVMNREKYREALSLMPDDFAEHIIEGGNHAGFGSYGKQDGDGEATISAEEQQKQTADHIALWVR